MTTPRPMPEIASRMSSMRIHDITLTIGPDTPVYPGNAPVEVEEVKSIAKGDSSNVSLFHIGSHTATHVDAPRHFLPQGEGVEAIPPDVLVGPARIFQLGTVDYIDSSLLETLDWSGVTRVLFGTGNSLLLRERQVHLDYAFLTADAAEFLVERKVHLVGLDYLSVEQYKKAGRPVHHTLLEAGIVVVEGLCLADVCTGWYELLCLPLKMKGADGAPSRVLLREYA